MKGAGRGLCDTHPPLIGFVGEPNRHHLFAWDTDMEFVSVRILINNLAELGTTV